MRDSLQANDITILFFYPSITHHLHFFFLTLFFALFCFCIKVNQTPRAMVREHCLLRFESKTMRSTQHIRGKRWSIPTRKEHPGADKLPLTRKPAHGAFAQPCLQPQPVLEGRWTFLGSQRCISPTSVSQKWRMLCTGCLFSLPREVMMETVRYRMFSNQNMKKTNSHPRTKRFPFSPKFSHFAQGGIGMLRYPEPCTDSTPACPTHPSPLKPPLQRAPPA